MENSSEAKSMNSPNLKTHKFFVLSQVSLRCLAFVATLAATWITLTNRETQVIFGMVMDARYSYSPAMKFFAIANLITCGFTILSLLCAFILGQKSLVSNNYFYLFIHDLVMTELLMAACAAATAIGYVGKYGNSHSGWMPICDHFARFCQRSTMAAGLSYLSLILYFSLTIISANKSRKIQL